MTSSNAPSASATSAWALAASHGNGRNRTVTSASGYSGGRTAAPRSAWLCRDLRPVDLVPDAVPEGERILAGPAQGRFVELVDREHLAERRLPIVSHRPRFRPLRRALASVRVAATMSQRSWADGRRRTSPRSITTSSGETRPASTTRSRARGETAAQRTSQRGNSRCHTPPSSFTDGGRRKLWTHTTNGTRLRKAAGSDRLSSLSPLA